MRDAAMRSGIGNRQSAIRRLAKKRTTKNAVVAAVCPLGKELYFGLQRGPFQNAYVGYWIDEARAGQGLMPEAVVVTLKYAFEELRLHRVQISIIPRNVRSRRVVDKLGIRCEGLAERYLEINGAWEDHLRYAITTEEWEKRREEFHHDWL